MTLLLRKEKDKQKAAIIEFTSPMYGCESWTMKKAECRRIDAFELWCWKDF